MPRNIAKIVAIVRNIGVIRNVYLTKKRAEQIKRKRQRRMWVRNIFCDRNQYGFFHTTYQSLKNEDHEMFFKTFRMSVPTLNNLLENIRPRLERTLREPIDPECRLAVTLM